MSSSQGVRDISMLGHGVQVHVLFPSKRNGRRSGCREVGKAVEPGMFRANLCVGSPPKNRPTPHSGVP